MKSAMLALLGLLAACAAGEDDGIGPTSDSFDGDWPADGSGLTKAEIFARLRTVAACPGLELRSDVDLDPETIDGVCAQARGAYRFDIALQGLAPSPSFEPPLVVGLASSALMGGRLGAAALSKDDVLAAVDQFSRPGNEGLAHYVLGHELTHLTMFRISPGLQGSVPVYLFEGIATSMGLWFTRQSGITSGWPFERFRIELGAVTRDDVDDTFAHFRVTSDYLSRTPQQVGLGEHIGGLFVEYLRAHVRADTHHRLGRVWIRLTSGESIDAAMLAEFGQSLSELESQFAEFIAATSDPTERFLGTVLDGG